MSGVPAPPSIPRHPLLPSSHERGLAQTEIEVALRTCLQQQMQLSHRLSELEQAVATRFSTAAPTSPCEELGAGHHLMPAGYGTGLTDHADSNAYVSAR